MFKKSYIFIVFKLKQRSCLFYHLPSNLRLLAAEALHEDDNQFGSGGGGDEDNEEEVVVVVVEEDSDSYMSAMKMVRLSHFP
jgi:hypothetical protein